MSNSSRLKNCLLIFSIACLFAFASQDSAKADGSWGSSRGGWGSSGGSGGSMGGGSYGCQGGGLFSRAPVRNLLSRVGSGIGNGIANIGDGIANIFERQPLRNGLFGSRGGWGSNGGYASNGSSGGSQGTWGSSGGWGCSGGGYAGSSTWSQPSYISAPATTLGSAIPMDSAVPIYDSGAIIGSTNMGGFGSSGSISAYVDPAISYGTISSPAMQYETSSQVLDYGYYGSQFGPIGIPTDATLINGTVITGPMLDVNGQSDNGIIETPGGSDLPGNDYYDGGSEPTPDDAFGAEEDDDSAYMPRGKAILSLDVPKDAKVFINDKLTRTSGTTRSYVSRNLIRGKEYRYRVKVVSEVDGKDVVKSRVVTMRGGEQNEVAFNFDPIVTRVVLSVPEDAKVIIDGKETSTAGAFRSFATQRLKSGKWDDYSVEVSVVRDGKTLTRKEKFDLAAGEFRFFEFDFDQSAANSIVKK
ncbi:TIGR03000 domain-containing protein [Mariniblastus fucicola]|uniref:TIGR03000 domain-containing protein n=1 Tax=Mariniblastus fucicola TaxID=980251 RepID=A0A5B9PCU9_9BACT|nr:TIGR03000 domain-containing protein [Mariniblastus fucicola]QEG24168.1 hypothetical protein MFFC18_40840 [Mariniblastus fucicola]